MIADHMRRLFSYNTWAWQQLFVSIEKLDATAYHASRPLFHNSLHGILVHSLNAEYIWFSRSQGDSPTTTLNPADFPDFTAVRHFWGPVRHGWANYLQWLSDENCKKFIEYRNTAGVPHTIRLLDLLQHVVNHGTEHRSQITPWLTELGVPTPPLDYLNFRMGM